MVPTEKLAQISERFEFLEAKMAQGGGDIAALGREYAEIRPVVEQIRAYTPCSTLRILMPQKY